MKTLRNTVWRAGAFALSASFAGSALANELNPDISVTLDGYYKQNDTAASDREKGLGLGHTELSLSSPIDDRFAGRLTAVFADHDGESEVLVEEAYIQSVGLPFGLQAQAGRFLSQVGYLNSRHMHEDDFVERPAAYRALLGGHYYDDGVQLTTLLPVPFYWQLGAEALNGEKFTEGDEDIGVYTVNTRIGGDLSVSQNWQLGLSYLHNRNLASANEHQEHDHDHHHEEEHDHAGHSHGPRYTAENLYVADVVWKYAPQGNNRQQQLTLSGEYLYADDINQFASSGQTHEGWYASAVYQFAPQWSAGVRYGQLDAQWAHGDHFHGETLEETDVMLAWSHSHFSTIRLQYTHQHGGGFRVPPGSSVEYNSLADTADSTVMLQYVMSLGAHGAHGY